MAVVKSNTGEKTVLLNEQEEILEKARFCKLSGIVDELHYQFSNPKLYQDCSFEQRISSCLESQINANRNALFNTNFKKSRMSKKYYLSNYTESNERGPNSKDIQFLRELNFIDSAINIVINGATGTGKTVLAMATGMEAIKHGHPVIFYRMSDLIMIMETKEPAAFVRFRDYLKKFHILILDDYGLERLSEHAVIRFYDILDCLYGNGSIIITTQLRHTSLKTAIPEKCTIREALMDRLQRPGDRVITLNGKSWRGSTGEFKGDK